jgi:hypothetical protein
LADLGVVDTLPVSGVSLLLGNDVVGNRVESAPRVTENPCLSGSDTAGLEREFPGLFPACAVTRSQKQQQPVLSSPVEDGDDVYLDVSPLYAERVDTQVKKESVTAARSLAKVKATKHHSTQRVISKETPEVVSKETPKPPSFTRSKLIDEQEQDASLRYARSQVLSDKEIAKVPTGFYEKSGVLCRKWRPQCTPADECTQVWEQVVVPVSFRQEVLSVSHEGPAAGHLGVKKTLDRVQRHYYWPKLKQDVVRFCKTCHTCQKVGKPNQGIPRAPLHPIPAFGEPFSRILIDCVGPLPKTKSGMEYLLTMMCASTRFPEAIPMRNITTKSVVKALVKFFTLVGLPRWVQSDQGSNFTSNCFKQVMELFGIEHLVSSAYHPESQGALERYHQTLKTMIRAFCFDHDKDWDTGVPLLLFATREVVQESLGFSPFDLVFGHTVRGPLKLLKDQLLEEPEADVGDILTYTLDFRAKLHQARKCAAEHLQEAQEGMKEWYDRKVEQRAFQVGDEVLVLLPMPGSPLRAKFSGPYVITRRTGDVDYEVSTPDRRRKKQLCHVNLLKPYQSREAKVPCDTSQEVKVPRDKDPAVVLTTTTEDTPVEDWEGPAIPPDDWGDPQGTPYCPPKLANCEILTTIENQLMHLTAEQRVEMASLLRKYKDLFPDTPGLTTAAVHDVDVGDARPVKQHAYRVNPIKREKLQAEVQYMLKNELVSGSQSPWSSPCILVPKSDNSMRFCTDFRKVNSVTKTDSYPIPRMDDCIDKVGNAKYVSKFDLMKGYWQVPMTPRAVEVSAFVTPDGLYEYKVMPFGMKNAGATFQRMMNNVIMGLEGCDVYIDDVVVYSDTWEQHIRRCNALFERLRKANLSVHLGKCEFGKGTVTFLGHEVGRGQVRPIQAKVEKILQFPAPHDKKGIMRFLGMVGYYRKFCPNFSEVAFPMTNLLRKGSKFVWDGACQRAFDGLKAVLSTSPVLVAPNQEKDYILTTDASDVGAGAVLQQEGEDGILYPVGYYSRKFNVHQQRYSTVEKEALALVLAITHFEVYLCTTRTITVYTDHNPLVFISRMKDKNQKILRWSIFLQQFNLDIKHISGRDNVIADALSRV